MPWRNALEPIRMSRVAVVTPTERLRQVLAAVADAGVVEIEQIGDPGSGPAAEVLERIRQRLATTSHHDATLPVPCLASDPPDLVAFEREGRVGELAGESELERVRASACRRDSVSALLGWSPTEAVASLSDLLASLGGAVVRLPLPAGAEPPTLVEARGATGAFQPLVDTYATVPYADVNPSAFVGVTYVVMFGMMFADVGHGALLAVGGLVLATGRPKVLVRFRRLAPFVIGAGLASALFGLAFGEAFGPTHIVPTLWMAPLDHPTTLLAIAVAVGAGLLAVSYAFGTVNRWREGGAMHALVATAGLAGVLLYLGLALVGLGWYEHAAGLLAVGGLLAAVGLGLGFVGCYAHSGGRATGTVLAGIELFDAVLRIGTNTVSFARLAAFGLTHAALGALVWSGTTGLWHRGSGWLLAAVAVFLVGNAVAFLLEGLVAGVQALRLEYYEMFSRIFSAEGRQFRPWHVPILITKEAPCSPGL